MAGETNLQKLIASMEPKALPDSYVFVSLSNAKYGDYAHLNPIASFAEQEGLTLIVNQQKADEAQFEYEGIYRCITLTVHSSLDAVGLTAAFANALKAEDISANVVAGFYHDHIFVQEAVLDKAINALTSLSDSCKNK